MSNYSNLLMGLLALCFIIYNQVRVREVKQDMKLTLPVIMLVLGVRNVVNSSEIHNYTVISWISILVSFSVLAVVMAGVRSYTVKLWTSENIIYRQGTWLTILLWIISIVLHLVFNRIGNVGESTSLIYFAITFTVQKLMLQRRIKSKFSN